MIPREIEEEFNKRAPFKLDDGTLLVLANIGSDSHGTKLPLEDPNAIDDIDYMGVVVPPIEYVFGIESWEGMDFWAGHYDCVFYSFDKFIRLLIKNNPNVLGMLWLRPQFIHHHTDAWEWLVEARDYFSSLKAYDSFAGYASGQLHRMTSYSAEIQNKIDMLTNALEKAGWHLNEVMDRRQLPMPIGITPSDANSMADRLRTLRARYHSAYQGEKRRNLVQKHGFDTKNAAHLIRLLRMAVEFLETGQLNVFRKHDREHLMRIKQGLIPLKTIQEEAEELFTKTKAAKAKSPLPAEPNRKQINFQMQEIYLHCYELARPLRRGAYED